MNNPKAKYTKTSSSEAGLALRRFWATEPRHLESILVEMFYLYRGTSRGTKTKETNRHECLPAGDVTNI